MTPSVAAPPSGVISPAASSAPPPASPAPATSALRLPGLIPICSKPWAVPSGPGPPNQPNSFCAPCAKNAPPTVTRSAVMPSLIGGLLNAGVSIGYPVPRRGLTEQPLQPERQRLAGEVVGDVQGQPGAEVVDELGGLAQHGEVAALGVARELPRLVRELALALLVLPAREVLELLGEPLLVLAARDRGARGGKLEQGEPWPLGAAAAVQRGAGEGLGVRAQRRTVPDDERERTLAVAEAQPRGGLGLRRRRAAGLQSRGQVHGSRRIEAHRLAARRDRRQHLRRPVRQQQED